MKTLLLAAAFASLASGVFAHSPLEATTPADGARLAQAPEELTFTFKRNIRLTRVTHTYAEGAVEQLDLDGQTNFATEFVFPLDGLGSGTYLIEWRGLGDDGHPQNGSFTFTVD